MQAKYKAHLYALLANILFGLNYAIAQVGLSKISPHGFVLARVMLAFLILFILYLCFIRQKVAKKD